MRRGGKKRHGPIHSRGMGHGHSRSRAKNAMHGRKGHPIVSTFEPVFGRKGGGRKRGRGGRRR